MKQVAVLCLMFFLTMVITSPSSCTKFENALRNTEKKDTKDRDAAIQIKNQMLSAKHQNDLIDRVVLLSQAVGGITIMQQLSTKEKALVPVSFDKIKEKADNDLKDAELLLRGSLRFSQ